MGRGLLSIVLMVLVACVIGWNLPGDSSVRDDVRSTVEPVVYALGIDQGWAVFTHNPSKTSAAVEAEVRAETFDLSIGLPLRIEDLFDPETGWLEALSAAAVERLVDQPWTDERRVAGASQ